MYRYRALELLATEYLIGPECDRATYVVRWWSYWLKYLVVRGCLLGKNVGEVLIHRKRSGQPATPALGLPASSRSVQEAQDDAFKVALEMDMVEHHLSFPLLASLVW